MDDPVEVRNAAGQEQSKEGTRLSQETEAHMQNEGRPSPHSGAVPVPAALNADAHYRREGMREAAEKLKLVASMITVAGRLDEFAIEVLTDSANELLRAAEEGKP